MTRGLKPTKIVTGSPLTKAPTPPAFLSTPAKAEWRRVASILVSRGILTTADLATLESYVISVGTIREVHRLMQIEGLVLENGKRHPAFGMMATAQTQLLRTAGELGLTPMSRSRSGMQMPDDDDADDNPLNVRRNA